MTLFNLLLLLLLLLLLVIVKIEISIRFRHGKLLRVLFCLSHHYNQEGLLSCAEEEEGD